VDSWIVVAKMVANFAMIQYLIEMIDK
jgi:hypothetical protein